MNNNLIVLALLSFPTIQEIVFDFFFEYKKGKRDNKVGDTIIRGIVIFFLSALSLFFGAPSLWKSMLLSTGIFIMFFDYTMGILLTNNPFFLGTTSQSDRKLSIWPWYLLLLARGLFFAATVFIYYYY